ncbi:hypothetical protein CR194_09555 [Salipaludibacillus keqinensis]|uniref:Uncharacterized protein n=2 Tax=Salipaludibacillus keqinensis TaxID=2045207 RepID=A0A323THK7_9BACI|nr:hypothetical protein CR194_09555 [Salipaludibacillus keqinensis]
MFVIFEKMKWIAWTVVLVGGLLLVVDIPVLSYVPYILMISGVLIHISGSLLFKKHHHPLCRIGFHQFELKSYDQEMKSFGIYTCKRCGKTKKAVKAGG